MSWRLDLPVAVMVLVVGGLIAWWVGAYGAKIVRVWQASAAPAEVCLAAAPGEGVSALYMRRAP